MIKISEHQHQVNLITWANLSIKKYPELRMLFSIPNGGSRNIREAVNLKKSGVKAGVSDLFLSVSRGGYHGLYIEMKTQNGELSKAQEEWLLMAEKEGYSCHVCYSYEEAKSVIENYIKLKR